MIATFSAPARAVLMIANLPNNPESRAQVEEVGARIIGTQANKIRNGSYFWGLYRYHTPWLYMLVEADEAQREKLLEIGFQDLGEHSLSITARRVSDVKDRWGSLRSGEVHATLNFKDAVAPEQTEEFLRAPFQFLELAAPRSFAELFSKQAVTPNERYFSVTLLIWLEAKGLGQDFLRGQERFSVSAFHVTGHAKVSEQEGYVSLLQGADQIQAGSECEAAL